MHVLYVIDSLAQTGGAEQALAATAPHLVDSGVDLDVAYLNETAGFHDELRSTGTSVFPAVEPTRLRRTAALHSLIRERRPDIVHTTLFEADLAGRAAATAARTPVVSSLVNVAYGPDHRNAPGLSSRKVRLAQAADAATCRSVRRFHALTEYVADEMAGRLMLRRSKIEVVPRGRDLALLGTRSAERRAHVREGLGLSPDVPLLVAAARHEHQKGLDTLVEALPEVRLAVPGAQLVIAGRHGNDTPKIRQLVADGGVEDAVQLLGSRRDVADLIAAADVFVAPSRWEGLGSAVMEAMGIGTPIVAGDVAAIRETVSGEGAILVPPSDPIALAKALVDVLQDPIAAEQRADVASERFRRRHTIEAVTARMIDFYEHALA